MSTTTDNRDARGITPGAPAWDGDLTALTTEELDRRIDSLGTHIGNCHTVWHSLDGWRAATEADLLRREVPRWVQARLEALRERETRRG
jgi:hypothetical protein